MSRLLCFHKFITGEFLGLTKDELYTFHLKKCLRCSKIIMVGYYSHKITQGQYILHKQELENHPDWDIFNVYNKVSRGNK
jgi:hypothetical protein